MTTLIFKSNQSRISTMLHSLDLFSSFISAFCPPPIRPIFNFLQIWRMETLWSWHLPKIWINNSNNIKNNNSNKVYTWIEENTNNKRNNKNDENQERCYKGWWRRRRRIKMERLWGASLNYYSTQNRREIVWKKKQIRYFFWNMWVFEILVFCILFFIIYRVDWTWIQMYEVVCIHMWII